MKTLKMLVLVAVIAFSGVLSASTDPNETAVPASINETVRELLKNPEFKVDKEIHAMVTVFIDENDKMVVVAVDTDNKDVEYFIKARLNHKKLSKEAIGDRNSFKIPVKLIKSK